MPEYSIPEGKKVFTVRWYEIREVTMKVIDDVGAAQSDIIAHAMNGQDVITESLTDEYYGMLEENWENGPLMAPSIVEDDSE